MSDSFLGAAAERSRDAAMAPDDTAPSDFGLASLDGELLQIIAIAAHPTQRALTQGVSTDVRLRFLPVLACVCRGMHAVLKDAYLVRMRAKHEQRTRCLRHVAYNLGFGKRLPEWGQLSALWSAHVSGPDWSAHASGTPYICNGACTKRLNGRQAYLMQDSDHDSSNRQQSSAGTASNALCYSCLRNQAGLEPPETCFALDKRHEFDHQLLGDTDLAPDVQEAAVNLYYDLLQAGYGLRAQADTPSPIDPPQGPLATLRAVGLSDLLVSGMGGRLLFLHLEDAKIGDEGLAALSRSLYACWELQFLNLNGNPAGDAGVKALAAALCRPFPFIRPPHGEGLIRVQGQNAALSLPRICSRLRYLYLVLENLGDDGAVSLAAAIDDPGSLPALRTLWCCGAFSEEMGGRGFRALTQAVDREGVRGNPIVLELDFGFVWGS